MNVVNFGSKLKAQRIIHNHNCLKLSNLDTSYYGELTNGPIWIHCHTTRNTHNKTEHRTNCSRHNDFKARAPQGLTSTRSSKSTRNHGHKSLHSGNIRRGDLHDNALRGGSRSFRSSLSYGRRTGICTPFHRICTWTARTTTTLEKSDDEHCS